MATTTAVDEVVQAKKLQLEHLLEKDAATLTLNNADLNVSFKDPMTAEELPAFTWLSILYACTKLHSIDAAKAKQSRFPPAVWEWMQGFVAQLKSDSEARAVFAGLRSVCVRWIGRVGLRRAFSLWDYLCWEGDQYDFEKVALRNMSDADAKRWLLDTVNIYGPPQDSFPYPEEVRMEIIHDARDFNSRRVLHLFQPFICGSETKTWIAEEPGYKPRYNPYKNFDNGTRELFFVLPIAVTWAIEAARSIQDKGHAEKLRLPKGRFPFPPTADSRSFHRSVQTNPPFRAQCIIIEKQNPLTCRLRVARVKNYVTEDQENPHYFLRCYTCWAIAVHYDCWARLHGLPSEDKDFLEPMVDAFGSFFRVDRRIAERTWLSSLYDATRRMLKGLEAFFGANLPQPVSGGTKDHLVQQLVAARDSATFLAAKVWERHSDRRQFGVEDSPYAADLQAHLGVETMHEVEATPESHEFRVANDSGRFFDCRSCSPTDGGHCQSIDVT
ncbi:hypothetical protein HDU88_004267 [Geranomyces variabilis]|nr:hypothetical protein HDU88_004267 [Geranomyces variabilis]